MEQSSLVVGQLLASVLAYICPLQLQRMRSHMAWPHGHTPFGCALPHMRAPLCPCHAALDWVANNAVHPAVVTMSLGVATGSWSRALEEAVRSLVVDHNITVVVAAGEHEEAWH